MRQSTPVGISAHSHDRRYRAQLLKHLGRAYVTGMDDKLYAFQRPDCLGTHKTVGIGYDTNEIFIVQRLHKTTLTN
jgi:hypothetical protein